MRNREGQRAVVFDGHTFVEPSMGYFLETFISEVVVRLVIISQIPEPYALRDPFVRSWSVLKIYRKM
jgi:hypothetical protein